MSVSVTDNDTLWRAIESDLKGLNKSHTKVGFMGSETREDGSGLTNAEVATFNEFGTAKAPARPFMRPAIAENKMEIFWQQEEGYSRVLQQQSTVGLELARIGQFAQTEIQKKIRSVKTPPNAISTIKRKGSNNPLIDTGAMRQSVTHKEVL
jgi:HK97 gp10 family phage protein